MEKRKNKLLRWVGTAVSFLLLLNGFVKTTYALDIVIEGNGESSVNEVVVNDTQNVTITQENNAQVQNEINVDANTGGNEVSGTTQADVQITTGNVETDITVENSLNSSSANLDCCTKESEIEVSGNGTDSINNVDLTSQSQTNITVSQAVNITNNIQGAANTGRNTAHDNTQGSVTIETGNINVGGGIINGPVNTENVDGAINNQSSVSALISDNGSDSQNKITFSSEVLDNMYSFSASDIANFVVWDLNTGENEVKDSEGDVKILTGDIFFDFIIQNVGINIGGISWDCCGDIFDPGENNETKPDDPGDENDEDKEDIGGSTNPSGSSNPSSGSLLPSAAATEAGGAGIYGLSDTSGLNNQNWFFFSGLILIVLGFRFLALEASLYNSSKD